MRSVLTTFLFALLLTALSGCIRYEEAIVVDKSGAGTATIVVSYPERGQVEKFVTGAGEFDDVFSHASMNKDLPAGVSLEHKLTRRDERIEVQATYTYDDIVKLTTWAARKDIRSPLSNISVLRKDDTLEFTRDFKRFEADQIKEIRKNCPDCTVTFKLTGPGKIQTHNATRTEGATVVWELKAPTLFADGGQTFKAAYSYGGNQSVLIIIIAIVIAVGAFVFWKRRRDRTSPLGPLS
jgi:hypothetical protein